MVKLADLVEGYVCSDCGQPTALDSHGKTLCHAVVPKCETCDSKGFVSKDPLCPEREGAWCVPCMYKLLETRRLNPISPLRWSRWAWPDVTFYLEQQQIMQSVFENRETFVVAGNKLGKDFVAGAIIVCWFLTGGGRRFNTETRIVTTSVNAAHLDVLWGEIHAFIEMFEKTGRALRVENGGPLIVLQQEIRKIVKDERGRKKECPKSYIKALVGNKARNMKSLAGHHAFSTLAVLDECSGMDNMAMLEIKGWAKSILAIGNADEAPMDHFFRAAFEAGDLVDPSSLVGA